MSKKLVTDELWELIEPLLPPEPPKPRGGRPRVEDRAALAGIIFVLKSGIPWEMLPRKMGCGSGSTCWRRLRDWQEAGVWAELHRVLLDLLGKADRIDWERASLDSASVPAKRGARRSERTRRIAANRVRSATLFRTEGASRSRWRSAPPTSTTRRSWRRPWTPSSRSGDPAAVPAGRASARRSCTPTRPTPSPAAARPWGRGA